MHEQLRFVFICVCLTFTFYEEDFRNFVVFWHSHSSAIHLGPQFGPIFQFSYCQTYGQVIDVTNHGK